MAIVYRRLSDIEIKNSKQDTDIASNKNYIDNVQVTLSSEISQIKDKNNTQDIYIDNVWRDIQGELGAFQSNITDLIPTKLSDLENDLGNIGGGGGTKLYRHTVVFSIRDVNHNGSYQVTYIEQNTNPTPYTTSTFLPPIGSFATFFEFSNNRNVGLGFIDPGWEYSRVWVFKGYLYSGTAWSEVIIDPNFEQYESFNDTVTEI